MVLIVSPAERGEEEGERLVKIESNVHSVPWVGVHWDSGPAAWHQIPNPLRGLHQDRETRFRWSEDEQLVDFVPGMGWLNLQKWLVEEMDRNA